MDTLYKKLKGVVKDTYLFPKFGSSKIVLIINSL